ncbi:MAG TPA: hypothetical protein PKE30_03875 [Niabella sp.]|nr:hypothetical protein [Niabella sp.]
MTREIKSYNDLLEEKQRLRLLLQAQKELVRQDIREIKEELAPVKSVISIAGKLVSKNKSNWLFTTAADKIIDLVVKKLILSRSGWLTRLAVPFVMKNFSSHIIAENKDAIIEKIVSFFTKKEETEDEPQKEPCHDTEED